MQRYCTLSIPYASVATRQTHKGNLYIPKVMEEKDGIEECDGVGGTEKDFQIPLELCILQINIQSCGYLSRHTHTHPTFSWVEVLISEHS